MSLVIFIISQIAKFTKAATFYATYLVFDERKKLGHNPIVSLHASTLFFNCPLHSTSLHFLYSICFTSSSLLSHFLQDAYSLSYHWSWTTMFHNSHKSRHSQLS